MVGVKSIPASEGRYFLVSVQLPEWSPIQEEGRLPGKEYDDVKQVHPVLSQGIRSNM